METERYFGLEHYTNWEHYPKKVREKRGLPFTSRFPILLFHLVHSLLRASLAGLGVVTLSSASQATLIGNRNYIPRISAIIFQLRWKGYILLTNGYKIAHMNFEITPALYLPLIITDQNWMCNKALHTSPPHVNWLMN